MASLADWLRLENILRLVRLWLVVGRPFFFTKENQGTELFRIFLLFSCKDSEGCRIASGNDILPVRCLQKRRPVRRIDWDMRLNLALSEVHEIDSNYRNPLLRTFFNKVCGLL